MIKKLGNENSFFCAVRKNTRKHRQHYTKKEIFESKTK